MIGIVGREDEERRAVGGTVCNTTYSGLEVIMSAVLRTLRGFVAQGLGSTIPLDSLATYDGAQDERQRARPWVIMSVSTTVGLWRGGNREVFILKRVAIGQALSCMEGVHQSLFRECNWDWASSRANVVACAVKLGLQVLQNGNAGPGRLW